MRASYRLFVPSAYVESNTNGFAALMNNATDGSVLRVRRIGMSMPYFHRLLNIWRPNSCQLARISAIGAAVGLDDKPVTVAKSDTSAAALPAAVVCRVNAPVTLSDVLLRQPYGSGSLYTVYPWATASAPASAQRILTQTNKKEQASCDLMYWGGFGQTQPIVLREGEGLAIVSPLSVSEGTLTAWVSMTMRDSATGKSYRYEARAGMVSPEGEALIALFNGAGSGVVLEVCEVSLMADRYPNVYQTPLRLSWIQDVIGGTEKTPLAYDTAKPCPSWVRAIAGPLTVTSLGCGQGQNSYRQGWDWNNLSQSMYVFNSIGCIVPRPSTASIAGPYRDMTFEYGIPGPYCGDLEEMLPLSGLGGGLVIQPGLGLALCNQSPYQSCTHYDTNFGYCYDLYFEFTVEPPSPLTRRATVAIAGGA